MHHALITTLPVSQSQSRAQGRLTRGPTADEETPETADGMAEPGPEPEAEPHHHRRQSRAVSQADDNFPQRLDTVIRSAAIL